MSNRIAAFALASLIALPGAAAFAAADVVLNDANQAQVRTVLTEQGYEVAKVKIEDGLYEAYARKDGERFEVFLNGDFEIVRVQED